MKEYGEHSPVELTASYRCQNLVNAWINDIVTPSNLIIRELHKTLMEGSPEYAKKGLTPTTPGNYRVQDLILVHREPNHLVRGLDIEPTMILYTAELDQILRSFPKSPLSNVDEVVKKGAWAYFVFERIHPFVDGNGRTGRMILKRILGGAGFRELLLHNQEWEWKQESDHIRALERVDETGNLLSLEIYTLETLLPRYTQEKELDIYAEISNLIITKKELLKTQKRSPSDLSAIWPPFKTLLAP